MASLNRICIIGNVGRDPEARQAGDKTVVSFSVACTEKRGGNESTTWFNIEAWDKLGEIVNKYVTKGKQVYIEGRVVIDEWDDKTTGAKRSKMKVVARDMILLGGKREEAPF